MHEYTQLSSRPKRMEKMMRAVEFAPTSDRKCSWTDFSASNKDWLEAVTKRINNQMNVDQVQADELMESRQSVDYLMAALSPSSGHSLSAGQDLELINKALSAIYEATEEKILSESEANALVEFFISNYIARRFGRILRNVFDVDATRNYSFRKLRGKSNYFVRAVLKL